MRRIACTVAVLAAFPLALHAQRLELAAPRIVTADSAPAREWCFGVKLRTRDSCANFALLEIGVRFRASGQTDHSTRDPAHAYPTLDDHGYIALGLAHHFGLQSALGAIAEYGGGGGERESIGVRFDQQVNDRVRLDFTAGGMRAQAHQRGVTRRRWANGIFLDGAIRANDYLVIQTRVDRIPGDGGLVRPANATYVGARVEGGGAVKTTIVASALMAALLIYAFFTDKS